MTCEASGKTCHDSKSSALRHMSNLIRRKGKAGGDVYKCKHCEKFHITKSKSINPKQYANSLRSTKAVRKINSM